MRRIVSQILKDIIFLNKHSLMDYSLLLITEVNPDFTESRKQTIQKKNERISSNSCTSTENPNNLAAMSKAYPSVVPEVPEAMENDESFTLPKKTP